MTLIPRNMIRKRLWAAAAATAGLVAYGAVGVAISAQGAAPAKSVWDAIYTQDQAKRGQAKYAQVCTQCHQADLSGSDQAPSLAGGEFLDRWNDQSLGDLADIVREFLPDAQITFENETGGRERSGNFMIDNNRVVTEFGMQFRPYRERILQIINEVRAEEGKPPITAP